MFIRVRRTFTLLALLGLGLLFILPGWYIRTQCRQMEALCRQTAQDMDEEAFAQLQSQFTDFSRQAAYFVPHGAMDEALAPLRRMNVYLSHGDAAALQASAEAFTMALDCIRSMETMDSLLIF